MTASSNLLDTFKPFCHFRWNNKGWNTLRQCSCSSSDASNGVVVWQSVLDT